MLVQLSFQVRWFSTCHIRLYCVYLMRPAAGSSNELPVYSQILSTLLAIQQQQSHMASVQDEMRVVQNQIVSVQAGIAQRVESLEHWQIQQSNVSEASGIFSSSPSLIAQASSVNGASALEPPWLCPLCFKPYKHRFSFRGHVRRLVVRSTRPKCHLNPRNQMHQILVHRFPGDDFYAQGRAFCREFHEFCTRAINRTRSDADARRLVSSWLEAARASDGREFPECSSSPDAADPVSGHSSSQHSHHGRDRSSSSGCCSCPCHGVGTAPMHHSD
jgi:hypothetical protein